MSIPYSYLICEDGAKIFNYVDLCIETVMLEQKEIDEIIPVLDDIKCDYYLDDGYSKTENKNDCVKIVVNCVDSNEKDAIVKLINDKVDVHIYASRTHVNIIHKTVNKERGIKKLFNLENLDYNLLHAIGDNDNDYQMLKTFNGVTVEKHHPQLDELNLKVYPSLKEYIEELM
jgi:hydroxymethylpyrimidine pyrophosphatase-like HAD family hydrolase